MNPHTPPLTATPRKTWAHTHLLPPRSLCAFLCPPERAKKPKITHEKAYRPFFWSKIPDKKIDGTFWAAFPVEDVPVNKPVLDDHFQKAACTLSHPARPP